MGMVSLPSWGCLDALKHGADGEWKTIKKMPPGVPLGGAEISAPLISSNRHRYQSILDNDLLLGCPVPATVLGEYRHCRRIKVWKITQQSTESCFGTLIPIFDRSVAIPAFPYVVVGCLAFCYWLQTGHFCRCLVEWYHLGTIPHKGGTNCSTLWKA